MIAIDTNIVVRYLTGDHPEQSVRARAIVDGQPVFESSIINELLEEIYPAASAKSKTDETFAAEAHAATRLLQEGDPGCKALWTHIMAVSVADLKKNYDNLNVSFDVWLGESNAEPYIEPMIAQTRTTLATTDTTIGVLQDSLALLLGDTRRLVNRADTLTSTVSQTATDVTPDIRQTLKNVYILSAKLEYFIDQVSRRPHRLLTGIRPLSRDSIAATAP